MLTAAAECSVSAVNIF